MESNLQKLLDRAWPAIEAAVQGVISEPDSRPIRRIATVRNLDVTARYVSLTNESQPEPVAMAGTKSRTFVPPASLVEISHDHTIDVSGLEAIADGVANANHRSVKWAADVLEAEEKLTLDAVMPAGLLD